MASITTRARANAFRLTTSQGTRVTLTELGRSNKWRKNLADKGVLELVDRSDTTGFIVSVDAMNDLLDALDRYESEAETLAVQPMFEARKDRIEAKSGIELRDAAMQALEDRPELMKFLQSEDEDK
ncbi:MAG: hypothetical protein E6965_09590 [Bifidobacterium bifidum]|nr:hypothetical protein [Bifidobacterium bifidum]